MKKLIGAILLAGIAALSIACAAPEPATTPQGVVLPYPAQGDQYRMSELCGHLESQGYDVRGTLHHTITLDDVGGVVDNLPSLARRRIENYFEDGVRVSMEIRSLCGALNR